MTRAFALAVMEELVPSGEAAVMDLMAKARLTGIPVAGSLLELPEDLAEALSEAAKCGNELSQNEGRFDAEMEANLEAVKRETGG